MQSEIHRKAYIGHLAKDKSAVHYLLQHRKFLCCISNMAQSFFSFLAILRVAFEALHAGRIFVLHGIER